MATVPTGHSVNWYRVKLPPGTLEVLNRRSDLLGLLQSLGYLGLVTATGSLAIWAAQQHHWLLLIGALILHGNIAAFMINAVHELVHGTVFNSRWLNVLFVHLFAFIGWINHRMFWASHAEHHLHTMHHPHDQENVFPIRYRFSDVLREATISPGALRWMLSYNWRVARGRLEGDWEKHLLEGQPRHRAVASWSAWLLIGHALIAIVSLAYGLWIIPVVVSLTPLYCKGLFWLLNNTQHVGLLESVPDFRLNCRTIIVNPIFRFLYWHMNWHIEHHMYAAVPCYRLGALHRAIAHELPPTPRGLIATWYHIIGVMFRQAQEPGWAYRAVLPGEAVIEAKPNAVKDATSATAGERRRVWQCSICGFVYDEALGLPAEGIPAGTAWGDVPTAWKCPDCGVAKADFAMVEIVRPVLHAGAADPVVIIGSGMAAYALARELRRLDPAQPISVLTRDDGAAYSKPALSSALAHGRTPDSLVTRQAAEQAKDLGIDIRTGIVVEAIERGARQVRWTGGALRYRHLVLALGAEPVRIPLAGSAADRVLQVNDLADYRVMRGKLTPGCQVVVIGAGLIGCEFADDLSATGHAVTVIDPAPEPLARLVPTPIGAALRKALAGRGVQWCSGTTVTRVERCADRMLVHTADGRAVEADVVLSAVGLKPRTALAAAAGLSVNRGIRVGRDLASDDPAISALGDCAEIDGQVMPYIQPLAHSARALAATLTGTPTRVSFPVMPVVVKTPAYPLLIIQPAEDARDWQIDIVGDGHVARCHDLNGLLIGLILAGTAVLSAAAEVDMVGRKPQPA